MEIIKHKQLGLCKPLVNFTSKLGSKVYLVDSKFITKNYVLFFDKTGNIENSPYIEVPKSRNKIKASMKKFQEVCSEIDSITIRQKIDIWKKA